MQPEFLFDPRLVKVSNGKFQNKKNLFLYLEKWTERTEEIWQRPLLQEGGLELERDDQQPDDDVRQGQVGDEEVGDGLHAAAGEDDEDDGGVAQDGGEGGGAVDQGKQDHHSDLTRNISSFQHLSLSEIYSRRLVVCTEAGHSN